jgi:hypothetical protein
LSKLLFHCPVISVILLASGNLSLRYHQCDIYMIDKTQVYSLWHHQPHRWMFHSPIHMILATMAATLSNYFDDFSEAPPWISYTLSHARSPWNSALWCVECFDCLWSYMLDSYENIILLRASRCRMCKGERGKVVNALKADRSSVSALSGKEPFPIQFFCHPHTPQLLFILGGKEVGGLLVIILQF